VVFSPGVAARLHTADNRGVFVKAMARSRILMRQIFTAREAHINRAPAPTTPVPRLLWSYDDRETGWVVLVFEEIVGGQSPAQPWRPTNSTAFWMPSSSWRTHSHPRRCPAGSVRLAGETLTPEICGWRQLWGEPDTYIPRLDTWSARHLEALAHLESGVKSAVSAIRCCISTCVRDNMLLTNDRVWIVDWPHAAVGAAWMDTIGFAPSVAMQGGPLPEDLLARHPASHTADPHAITTAVAAIAGYFIHRRCNPAAWSAHLARLSSRAGVVAREWLAERTGWV